MKLERITATARKSFLVTLAICFIVYAFSSVFGGLIYLFWNDLENMTAINGFIYVGNFLFVFMVLELTGGPPYERTRNNQPPLP